MLKRPFLSFVKDELGALSVSRLFKMTVQQGRRRSKNRRRTLWGTLRIVAS